MNSLAKESKRKDYKPIVTLKKSKKQLPMIVEQRQRQRASFLDILKVKATGADGDKVE